MKEIPILFKGEMVRAIRDRRKTMTRRVIKLSRGFAPGTLELDDAGMPMAIWRNTGCFAAVPCRYAVGDVLWVRENFRVGDPKDKDGNADGWYIADGAPIGEIDYSEFETLRLKYGKTYPSIFMPKWACRLWLRVTEVRMERLQEIDSADIGEEGLVRCDGISCGGCVCWTLDHAGKHHPSDRSAFRSCWDSINAKRGFGWDVNPLVRAISFERVDEP